MKRRGLLIDLFRSIENIPETITFPENMVKLMIHSLLTVLSCVGVDAQETKVAISIRSTEQ